MMVQSLKCLHTNNGIGISTDQNQTVKVLWNESSPAAHCLQNQYSQMLLESKGDFNQNARNLGRWWTQCFLKISSKDSAGP